MVASSPKDVPFPTLLSAPTVTSSSATSRYGVKLTSDPMTASKESPQKVSRNKSHAQAHITLHISPNPLMTKAIASSSSSSSKVFSFDGLLRKVSGRHKASWLRFYKFAASDRDCCNLAIYFGFLALYMSTELFAGMLTGSLGLITDAFHTLFDCGVLVFSFFAMIQSRRAHDNAFSYGYERCEIISGFGSACFLLFLALFTILEGAHEFFTEAHHAHYLPFFVVFGLFMNLIGLFLFRANCVLPTNFEPPRTLMGGRGFNLHGIFLYIFCDALSKLLVLGVILLPSLLKWSVLYFAINLMMAVVIFFCAYPLFRRTGMILMQTRPPDCNDAIRRCLRDISAYEGVLECRSSRWWAHVPGDTYGMVFIRVRAECDEQDVLSFAYRILSKSVPGVCVQIEKDWILTRVDL